MVKRLLGVAVLGLAGAVAGAALVSAAPHRGCPLDNRRPLVSRAPGAGAQLVPPGAQQVLLCRYGGLLALRLIDRQTISDRKTVASLAADFDRLPSFKGTYSCPADRGAAIVAFFRYPAGPQDPVTVHLGGCAPATNGHVTKMGGRLIGRLTALLHPARVDGYVDVCGGPAPGGCHITSFGDCQPPNGCVTSDRVAVIDGRGHRVAQRRLHRGRFQLSLKPGTYTFELLGDGRRVHGQVIQKLRKRVRAERITSVRFFFAVP